MATKVTVNELLSDFEEAMTLLLMAGPNPLMINEDEYYERLTKLRDKYKEPDPDDDGFVKDRKNG